MEGAAPRVKKAGSGKKHYGSFGTFIHKMYPEGMAGGISSGATAVLDTIAHELIKRTMTHVESLKTGSTQGDAVTAISRVSVHDIKTAIKFFVPLAYTRVVYSEIDKSIAKWNSTREKSTKANKVRVSELAGLTIPVARVRNFMKVGVKFHVGVSGAIAMAAFVESVISDVLANAIAYTQSVKRKIVNRWALKQGIAGHKHIVHFVPVEGLTVGYIPDEATAVALQELSGGHKRKRKRSVKKSGSRKRKASGSRKKKTSGKKKGSQKKKKTTKKRKTATKKSGSRKRKASGSRKKKTGSRARSGSKARSPPKKRTRGGKSVRRE